nr:hypothetical protein [Massilia sp. PDC64]
MLKGLRVPEALEQTLLLAGTKTGQKFPGRVARRLRTFDPVDIQQLIHKRGENRGAVVFATSLVDVVQVSKLRSYPESGKFFFRQDRSVRSGSSGLQPKAYIQNDGNS